MSSVWTVQNVSSQINSSVEESFLGRLKTLGGRFCHNLHMKRLQLHRKILQ